MWPNSHRQSVFSAIFVIRNGNSLYVLRRVNSESERPHGASIVGRPYGAYHFDRLQAPCHVINVESEGGKETLQTCLGAVGCHTRDAVVLFSSAAAHSTPSLPPTSCDFLKCRPITFLATLVTAFTRQAQAPLSTCQNNEIEIK